jgi:hypothetical protein
MPFTQEIINQIATQRFAEEEARRKAEAEKVACDRAAASAALAEAERLARIRAEQEREEARLRAERALAEEKMREEAAALEAAVEAELERLRNRSELEVLRDEVAELKKQLSEINKPFLPVTVSKTSSSCCERKKWLGYLKINPSSCGWVDPTPGTEKELWLVYKDYTTGCGVERQMKYSERDVIKVQAINMEIVSAIWRGKVFGGRTEGFGPRSVPLMLDNPYNKAFNPACPLGELDVADAIRKCVCINDWH